MELREALTQISEIRQQMARTEVFRGYRAVPVAFSGALAVLAAVLQTIVVPDPSRQATEYLLLWAGTAALSALVPAVEMGLRSRTSVLRREITWLAVEQFVPSLVAGGLLTLVLAQAAPECLWLLPGLWQILFSLGVFASCRLLPRATFLVAFFYLFSGLTTLAAARGDAAFSPWAMGLPFGVGQMLAAGVLYRTLECRDV